MRHTSADLCFYALLMTAILQMGCNREPSNPRQEHAGNPNLTISSRAIPETVQPSENESQPADVLFVEYVPTPRDVVTAMLKMAAVTETDVVYDLGCGDGRVLVAAAKEYGCRAYGCDLDRLRVKEAQENARKNHVEHLVTIEEKDVLRVDLSGASVVALYLSPELLARLIPQLKRLPTGARIVSHDFPIPGIPADKERKITSREDNREHMIYLWTRSLATRP